MCFGLVRPKTLIVDASGDLQNSILILSNGAVWTLNASLLKTNIRALMGPYGPQPGPARNVSKDNFQSNYFHHNPRKTLTMSEIHGK